MTSKNNQSHVLPPTSKLPRLPRVIDHPLPEIGPSLAYLRTLYSPEVRGSRRRRRRRRNSSQSETAEYYASQLDEIRADKFERDFATRWLIGLISTIHIYDSSDTHLRAFVDDASSLLALWAGPASSGRLTRTFSYGPSPLNEQTRITLTDVPLENGDYGTLGAQTWGGACVMADMIVEDPGAFGIPECNDGRKLRVLELGAGTGLVGLTIAHILRLRYVDSEIILTDFHSSILENLRTNVEANFPVSLPGSVRVQCATLDWSKFPHDEAQRTALGSFDIIIGADIIYEEQHAAWIKTCLEYLLSSSAAFYLVIPLRPTHAFESSTVSTVFDKDSMPGIKSSLVILDQSQFTCDTEDGRDEVEYAMFKVGWS